MYLESISLINFKNFDQIRFDFDEKINCLVGNNGVGKTNVLDAIYYLAHTRGYFNPIASQNIRHGQDFFVIDGVFNKDGRQEHIHCSLKIGQKKIMKRNGKEYEKLSDHYGFLPLVIISPSDTDLIIEGSEVRRKFMDMIISMNDSDYFQRLIRYNRAVTQRNALLKYFASNFVFNRDNLEVYDIQLIENGTEIFRKRQEFVREFTPIFHKWHSHIIDRSQKDNSFEKVAFNYRSKLSATGFADLLKERLEKDKMLQYTSAGVHRDDLSFEINEHPIKKVGSQGQQKSFLIALKLAQFDFIKKKSKMKPILLLDDIFDKLDDNRVGQLLHLVNDENFGQLFITDTHDERTERLIRNTGQSFTMYPL